MNVKYRRKNLKSYSDGVTKIEPKIARKGDDLDFYSEMVRMKGLEPSRSKAHAPKACVSTNSTTSASVCKL